MEKLWDNMQKLKNTISESVFRSMCSTALYSLPILRKAQISARRLDIVIIMPAEVVHSGRVAQKR